MRAAARQLWIGLLAAAAVGCGMPEGLPVWAELPDFTLADQDAQSFGSEQLHGQVWVADFVFTRCPSRCPMLTRKMADVQRKIGERGWDDVRLVSISVDPEYDTPERLAEYADRHGADGSSWRFLTGPRAEVWQLSVDGFKLPVAETEDTGNGPILHSNKFVLADRAGRIRGYYDALVDDDLAKLLDDLDEVRAEPAPPTG